MWSALGEDERPNRGMPSCRPEIRILANAEELARAAAEEFVNLAREAIGAKEFFTVALSGGSTPRGLYSLVAGDTSLRAQLPWEKIHFFWGDERHVPPEHPDSNYRMAKDAMLSKVRVPPANVHRIRSENPDAGQAAGEYEETLRTFFRPKIGEMPRFDLILLGMGPDGHTASLFPGTQGLHEQKRMVMANWVERLKDYRITMTLPLLNHAACVLFLVSGEEKAETLRVVLENEPGREPLPAQLVRPVNGRFLWFVDQAAARLLRTI
jgi:6-phosphogluconolactonase